MAALCARPRRRRSRSRPRISARSWNMNSPLRTGWVSASASAGRAATPAMAQAHQPGPAPRHPATAQPWPLVGIETGYQGRRLAVDTTRVQSGEGISAPQREINAKVGPLHRQKCRPFLGAGAGLSYFNPSRAPRTCYKMTSPIDIPAGGGPGLPLRQDLRRRARHLRPLLYERGVRRQPGRGNGGATSSTPASSLAGASSHRATTRLEARSGTAALLRARGSFSQASSTAMGGRTSRGGHLGPAAPAATRPVDRAAAAHAGRWPPSPPRAGAARASPASRQRPCAARASRKAWCSAKDSFGSSRSRLVARPGVVQQPRTAPQRARHRRRSRSPRRDSSTRLIRTSGKSVDR